MAPGYSGGVAVRTLQAMLAFVRDGDTVVVHSMDRLARSIEDIAQLIHAAPPCVISQLVTWRDVSCLG